MTYGTNLHKVVYANVRTAKGDYLLSTFDHNDPTRTSTLWRASEVTDSETWEKQFAMENCISPPKGLHQTANGTVLWSPGDGHVYRATRGNSYEKCLSLTNGYYVWNFTENTVGDILAGNYGKEPRLYRSRDGGDSWEVLAGPETLDFPTHVHKVGFNPHNGWIVVTGGDGINYYYRSTDNGATWDRLSIPCQMVGLTFHPERPDVYFLGGDYQSPPIWWYYRTLAPVLPDWADRFSTRALWLPSRLIESKPIPSGGFPGVYRVTDDGGSEVSVTKVLSTDRGAMGCFVLRTVRLNGVWRYVAGTTSGGHPNCVVRFWLSEGPCGETWFPLYEYRGDGSHCLTTTSGADNRAYTDGEVPYLVANAVGNGVDGRLSGSARYFELLELAGLPRSDPTT